MHSCSHLLFDAALQELAQFSVQVVIRLRLPEEAAEAADDAVEEGHHNSSRDARRILPMAFVCTSQSRVSRFSLARPCAVSE